MSVSKIKVAALFTIFFFILMWSFISYFTLPWCDEPRHLLAAESLVTSGKPVFWEFSDLHEVQVTYTRGMVITWPIVFFYSHGLHQLIWARLVPLLFALLTLCFWVGYIKRRKLFHPIGIFLLIVFFLGQPIVLEESAYIRMYTALGLLFSVILVCMWELRDAWNKGRLSVCASLLGICVLSLFITKVDSWQMQHIPQLLLSLFLLNKTVWNSCTGLIRKPVVFFAVFAVLLWSGPMVVFVLDNFLIFKIAQWFNIHTAYAGYSHQDYWDNIVGLVRFLLAINVMLIGVRWIAREPYRKDLFRWLYLSGLVGGVLLALWTPLRYICYSRYFYIPILSVVVGFAGMYLQQEHIKPLARKGIIFFYLLLSLIFTFVNFYFDRSNMPVAVHWLEKNMQKNDRLLFFDPFYRDKLSDAIPERNVYFIRDGNVDKIIRFISDPEVNQVYFLTKDNHQFINFLYKKTTGLQRKKGSLSSSNTGHTTPVSLKDCILKKFEKNEIRPLLLKVKQKKYEKIQKRQLSHPLDDQSIDKVWRINPYQGNLLKISLLIIFFLLFKGTIKPLAIAFKEKTNLFALAFCAVSSYLWMVFIAKWYYFRYTGGWDTAYFIQTLWGLGHGKFSPSVLNANFLADHFHLFTFFLVPLYKIFPDPMLLQDIKIGAFFAGVYIFFLILKKKLHPLVAFGAMVAFSVAPANVAMLRFAFTYEALSIPIILLIFKAFDDQKYKLYIISCFFLMMVKEQMPLVVMSFGMTALLFRKDEKIKWGLVPLLMGLCVFMVEVFIFLPHIRDNAHIDKLLYWYRYFQFGKTPQEIVFFLITHPARIWAECTSQLNIQWYKGVFGVWGGLGFLSPQLLLPAFPLFLKMALSSESVEHSVVSVYYACVFTPFVFLATWNTLNHIQSKWKMHCHLFVLGLMFIHAFYYIPVWLNDLSEPMTADLLVTQRFINEIPARASVLSSRKAMTYLADRENLYQLKDYFNGSYYISRKKFILHKDINYALVDFSEFNNGEYQSKVTAFNFGNLFKLKESIEDVALYVKNTPQENTNRLIEKSDHPFLEENMGLDPVVYKGVISLEDIRFPKNFSHSYRIFPVTMYWKSVKKTTISYEILTRITQRGKIYYEKRRAIGSSIYPTRLWKKGEHIKEHYFYLLPHLKPGEYSIEVQIYNPKGNQQVDCVPAMSCSEKQYSKVFIY